MKLKEFFKSGPAGIAAGLATVMLGGGAVAALAFSSPEPAKRPMGDARLSVGSQAFDAALVSNAGANKAGARSSAARGMADGSRVAGPDVANRTAAGPGVSASADGSSASQSSSGSTSTVPARPGSAEYYRALLSAGSGGAGSLAMMPRGAMGRSSSGGRLAGDLTGANATDYASNRASTAVRDPLVPSRAFSSYGTNDAGSSPVTNNSSKKASSARPAIGTSPVGPASKPASSSSRPGASSGSAGMPATSAPLPATPTRPTNSSSASNASGMVSSGSPAVVTDPLGERKIAGSVGNAVNMPAAPTNGAAQPGTSGTTTPAGSPTTTPTTSVVVGSDMIVTPEPGTWVMVGSGLLLLGIAGRRRVNQSV